MIGRTLAHYRILALAGHGGMGEVFLAEDTRLGRKVALKVLPAAAANDPDRLSRFRREARAVAALNHANIVVIHSVEEAEGVPFLTMELVEGETLAARIGEGGIPFPELLDVCLQIVDALAAAHESGVVHRDLKPANVMITPRGRVKILDFGLARRESDTARDHESILSTEAMTQEGLIVGTVPYMSPEQLQGKTAEAASDLFSMGTLLYEMATGHRPFTGLSSVEIASSILRDTPPPPSHLRADLPEALDAIVGRCLEKVPKDRWSSARDLHQALATLVERAPSGETATPRVSAAPRIAVLDFSNITRDPEVEWLATGIAETITSDIRKFPTLSVVTRDRVVQAAARSGGSPSEVGKRLGARWIVHGSFQKQGDAVRITAAFSDVESGEISETTKVDGRLNDIFELQDRVVAALLAGFKVRPSEIDRGKLEKPQTLDLGAYEYYAKGRMRIFRMGKDSLAEAEAAFLRAVELDPEYPLPYSGLGQCYAMRFIGTADTKDLQTSIGYLKRAAALDPNLTDPYVWLAYSHARLHEFTEAGEAVDRAVTLDPEDPSATYMLGVTHVLWAEEEPDPTHFVKAETALRTTISLVPRYEFGYTVLAVTLEAQGRLDEARSALRKAVEIEESNDFELSRFVGAHSHLALLEYRSGNLIAASTLAAKSLEALAAVEHVYRHQFLAVTYSVRGDIAYAERRFDEALNDFRFAIRHIDDHPRYLGMGRIRARAILGLARCLRKLGLPQEAKKSLEEAEAILEGRQNWDMSWIWGNSRVDLLLELAGTQAQLGREEEAMGTLRKAVSKGLMDAPRLRLDPLLVPLTARSDFAALCNSLAGQ